MNTRKNSAASTGETSSATAASRLNQAQVRDVILNQASMAGVRTPDNGFRQKNYSGGASPT
jgi:hypothetical protein